MPPRFQDSYLRTLFQFESAFSVNALDLGWTDIVEHSIELASNQPSFRPQFRLPAEHLQLIKANVAGWIKAGIISPSRSRYNSAIFVVPKKDRTSLRPVLDYRHINRISLEDKYSIRSIDECLERIGATQAKVFSTLDCKEISRSFDIRAQPKGWHPG